MSNYAIDFFENHFRIVDTKSCIVLDTAKTQEEINRKLETMKKDELGFCGWIPQFILNSAKSY